MGMTRGKTELSEPIAGAALLERARFSEAKTARRGAELGKVQEME